VVHTDGAARGNPGPAGAGWVIETADGELVEEGCAYLGELTNNQAEYEALLHALRAVDPGPETEIEIRADSELMVRQLNGEYRVKNAELRPRYDAASRALSRAGSIRIGHVRRDENARADELANRAIDMHFESLREQGGQTVAGGPQGSLEESPGSTGQDARGPR
jgi:ribonuclease HI